MNETIASIGTIRHIYIYIYNYTRKEKKNGKKNS